MRRASTLAWAFLAAASPVCAQDAVLRVSAQAFDFGDPQGAGLESYSVLSTTFGVAFPVLSWLSASANVSHATASLGPVVGADETLTGLTDASFSASVFAGPVHLRATYLFPTGSGPRSAETNVVEGVAADEYLPLSVRHWGIGGGYGFEATVPTRARGFDVELFGGAIRYGAMTPTADPTFEYRMGLEPYVGVRVGRRLTALSYFELRGRLALPTADDVDASDPSGGITHYEDIFSPGARMAVDATAGFSVGRTAVALRADLYRRANGIDGSEPVPSSSGRWAATVTPVAGTGGSPSRFGVAIAADTRTERWRLPLLVSLGARVLRREGSDGSGRLVTLGIGTEVPVFVPLPGRLSFVPFASVGRGSVNTGDGFESSVASWELSVTGHWAGRP